MPPRSHSRAQSGGERGQHLASGRPVTSGSQIPSPMGKLVPSPRGHLSLCSSALGDSGRSLCHAAGAPSVGAGTTVLLSRQQNAWAGPEGGQEGPNQDFQTNTPKSARFQGLHAGVARCMHSQLHVPGKEAGTREEPVSRLLAATAASGDPAGESSAPRACASRPTVLPPPPGLLWVSK